MIGFLLMSVALAASPEKTGVSGLAHVEAFTVAEPVLFAWNAEAHSFTTGTLFVVAVDQERAKVRQVGGPVLYVGTTPAARLNPGHLDGHIVAYVPGDVDLSKTPIFWGPSTLPEQVIPSDGGAQALQASRATPFPADVVIAATHPRQSLTDQKAIQLRAAELIDRFAPGDADFARGYRAGQRR